MINKNINYSFISEALEFYKCQNYKYIEVPWVVSHNAIEATFDGHSAVMAFKDKAFYPVASAEQSFVQMMIDGKLYIDNKYVAVSPCYRLNEDDSCHNPWFFKVELIHILPHTVISKAKTKLKECMNDAEMCMKLLALKEGKNINLNKVFSDEMTEDLELSGLEVGSYGVRQYKNYTWICGTGLAEPRFSLALDGVSK